MNQIILQESSVLSFLSLKLSLVCFGFYSKERVKKQRIGFYIGGWAFAYIVFSCMRRQKKRLPLSYVCRPFNFYGEFVTSLQK